MKKLNYLIVACSLLTTVVGAQDKDPQADYDWAQYDFTPYFTIKNGGGKKTFAENKRIFIANFQISQVVAANGKQTGNANLAKMTIGMTPIDLAKYQVVIDKLYKQVTDKWIAEGYTIVGDDEVANTEFVMKENNGKSIFCQYVKAPVFSKDGNGNEMLYLWPTNKYIVLNTNAIQGNWPTKFGKSINANAVSITLTISPVSFDGSRGGGKKGPSISAVANMTITPSCLASNDHGGFGVWGTAVDGKANWVGPKGLSKDDSRTDFFGSVRGTYVLDVNEDIYLSEVEGLGGGIANGYVKKLLSEIKE